MLYVTLTLLNDEYVNFIDWNCKIKKRNSNLKGNEKQLSLWGIWIIRLNLSEILIKGKENLFQLAGNSSNPSLSRRGSTVTAKKIIRG